MNLPVTTTQIILRTMVRSIQAEEEVGTSSRPWRIGPTRMATLSKIISSDFRIDHGKKEPLHLFSKLRIFTEHFVSPEEK